MILSSADILQVIGGDAVIRYLAKVQIVDGKPAITGEEGLFIYIDRFPIEREFEAVWKLWVMDYSGEPVDLVINRIKILLPSVQIFETALGYEIESTDFKYESTQTKPVEKELSLPDLSSYEDRFKALSESIEDRMLTVFDGQPGRDGKDGKDGVDGRDGKDLDATEVDLGDLADVDLQSYLTLEKGHVLTWDGDRWTNLFVPQIFNTGRGSETTGSDAVSTTIQWKYHIGTGEPPARDFHTDNVSDPTAITIIHVSDVNNAGTDVTSLLNGLLPNTDKLYVYKVDEPSSAHLYTVNSFTETTDGYEISVTHVETPGGEPNFVNNSIYGFTFITAGTGGGGGISDAPADNVPYVRYNNTWISWAEARDITAQLADIVDGGDFDQNLSATSTNTIYDGGDFQAGTSVATDQEVIDGGEFTPEQDTILDGGIATL